MPEHNLEASEDFQCTFRENGDLLFKDNLHGKRLFEGFSRVPSGSSTTITEILRKSLTTTVEVGAENKQNVQLDYTAVMKTLSNLRSSRKLCDVVLCVSRAKFHCHRAVLASFSHFFARLLLGDFKEGQDKNVWLNDVSSKIVDEILTYVYTGSFTVTRSNVERLVHSATLFQLPMVVITCCQYLSKQLCVENCFGIWVFAEAYSCLKLAQEARGLALDNLPRAARVGELDVLSFDHMLFLITDERCVWSTEVLYEVVMQWARGERTRREHHLRALLRCLDLSRVHPDFFNHQIKNDPFLNMSPECLQLVLDAEQEMKEREQRRLPDELIAQVGGTCSDQNTGDVRNISYIDCLDVKKKSRAVLTDLPSSLDTGNCYRNVLSIDDAIYVLSSMERPQYDSEKEMEFWRYSTSSDTWARLPDPLTFHEGHCGFVAVQGRIYAIGSNLLAERDQFYYEAFSLKDNSWCMVPPVPHTVHKIVAVSCQNKLVVLGYFEGWSKNYYIQTRHRGVWDYYEVEAYHGGKPQFQAVCVGTRIYLLPMLGRLLKQMCAFDVETSEFNMVPVPTYSPIQCGMTVMDEQVVVTGGRDQAVSAYSSNAIEAYDSGTGKWVRIGWQVEPVRRAHSCVTIPNCQWIQQRLEGHEQSHTETEDTQ
ncbi:kelch-like protein 21 [Branchiostoma lanceolatum]|uniref:kelch-like protein 21 n=1 Tax=Branchiostoma lanceolatum TaxID=7740 RepID=UPI00345510F5